MTRDTPFLGLDAHRYRLSRSLSDDIALLDAALGAVLSRAEDAPVHAVARRLYAEPDGDDARALFDRMPELRDAALAQRVLHAYTMIFQLMNTAEQKEIVRVNRLRQAEAGGSARTESIAEAVCALQKAGVSASEMQRLVDRLEVCPTLTAHPTEARRRSVLDKLQAVARTLVDAALPAEAPLLDEPLNAVRGTARALERELTALWQTPRRRSSARKNTAYSSLRRRP